MARLLLEIGDADRPVELQYSTRCLRRVLSSTHRHGRLPLHIQDRETRRAQAGAPRRTAWAWCSLSRWRWTQRREEKKKKKTKIEEYYSDEGSGSFLHLWVYCGVFFE